MQTNILIILILVVLNAIVTSANAAKFAGFEYTSNIATMYVPFDAGKSYVNNETLSFSIPSPQLGTLINMSGRVSQTDYMATPIRAFVFALALDDNPDLPGGRCVFGFFAPYQCLDGVAPPNSVESQYKLWGDSEQEYLQIQGGQPIAIDTPSYIRPNLPGDPNDQPFYGTMLGEIPLSALASPKFNLSLTVTGDLYLAGRFAPGPVLVVDYQLQETSTVPLPPSMGLFTVSLLLAGFNGLKRNWTGRALIAS